MVAATFLVDSESRLKTPATATAPARTTGKPASAPEPMAAAKTVRDPSCGMTVDLVKAVAAGNTVAYNGSNYYFCSSKCKQAFQNDPLGSASRRQGADE